MTTESDFERNDQDVAPPDPAGEDIEAVLNSRRKLPSLAVPAPRLKARTPAVAPR